MAKYYKLKDQKSSGGLMVAGVVFNNSTVKAYEDNVPASIQIAVRAGQLTEAKESDYKEFLRLQEIAIENGKAAKIKKEAQNLKRLAAATGQTEEELLEKKKEVASKAEAEKENADSDNADDEEKEGADAEKEAPKKEKSKKTKGE